MLADQATSTTLCIMLDMHLHFASILRNADMR